MFGKSSWPNDPQKYEIRRLKMIQSHKGLKWWNNGIIEKTIQIGENLPEGFRFGRCCNKCRKK